MLKLLRSAKKKDLRGTALLRLDLNADDDWRIEACLPTIHHLLRSAEKIVIVSHRGRPKRHEEALTLRPDARRISRLLRHRVRFIPSLDFVSVHRAVSAAPRRSVFLLENLRFLPGETKNASSLAKSLASLADFYVNDAFAVSHRVNASIVAITRFLPSYMGFEFEREVKELSVLRAVPKRPLVMILGGAKAHEKLGVMHHFKDRADAFLVGGIAANTLLKLLGVNVNHSLVATDPRDLKRFEAFLRYPNLVLPVDYARQNGRILDIGAGTARRYREVIATARTIFWSGALGMIERPPFDRGTREIASAIAKNRHAYAVAGGGETVTFIRKRRLTARFAFLSTGGGAMLEFLAGEKLPGIEALKEK